MLNFIVDYVDARGNNIHNSFQAIADNKWIAFSKIIRELFLQGCIPISIIRIIGNYTFEQLEELAKNRVCIPFEVMYYNHRLFSSSRVGAEPQ